MGWVWAAELLAFSMVLLGCTSPPKSLDPRLGGSRGSVVDTTRFAFSHPLPGLSPKEREDFFVGNNFFMDNWVTAPSSTAARDGLGPTFNARSCSACHDRDGRGRLPEGPGEPFVSALVRVSLVEGGKSRPVPAYGFQIQSHGIVGVPEEARPEVVGWEVIEGRFADGSTYELVRPLVALQEPQYGPFPPHTAFSVRVAPQLIGLGLLEAVPEATLEALADPEDRDGDGISGRVHRYEESGRVHVGRFGWKAASPSVEVQTARAFLEDMGITTRLFPEDNCPEAQEACRRAFRHKGPEASDFVFDAVVFYTRTLAVPAMRNHEDPQVIEGASYFEAIGCAACHTPTLRTGPSDIAAIANQEIHPYTDLLLHEMGPELADGRPEGEAGPAEWRTPPLWGIGLIETVNRHSRFLHDGRARNLEEAILWHGGEAESSRENYLRLPRKGREALLRFLSSL
ncbi:MAG: thiol oxidoreductase [Deltaproteobacteria bacterium]|nr:thiol oxidoreductase [Sandaracinaceae bacterium]MCX7808440.1 thiol oxidoreductase [Deltaproteobacteria bacterium]MDW8246453.1 di-heme oxidoredictase family protein [Sandaracinaceae bacterium]